MKKKLLVKLKLRETFKVSKIGTIAGSYVTEGKITRDSGSSYNSRGIVIFEGEIDTLKRFKDDVKEVAKGYECGITIKNFNDIKEGDIIEAFIMEEIKRRMIVSAELNFHSGCPFIKRKTFCIKTDVTGDKQKFNVSIAEMDHQDVWQRTTNCHCNCCFFIKSA